MRNLLLPAAEGEVEVVGIQDKHTKQYGGQNEPRAFIFTHKFKGRRGGVGFLSSTLPQNERAFQRFRCCNRCDTFMASLTYFFKPHSVNIRRRSELTTSAEAFHANPAPASNAGILTVRGFT